MRFFLPVCRNLLYLTYSPFTISSFNLVGRDVRCQVPTTMAESWQSYVVLMRKDLQLSVSQAANSCSLLVLITNQYCSILELVLWLMWCISIGLRVFMLLRCRYGGSANDGCLWLYFPKILVNTNILLANYLSC
jgi:hypothetical protein